MMRYIIEYYESSAATPICKTETFRFFGDMAQRYNELNLNARSLHVEQLRVYELRQLNDI